VFKAITSELFEWYHDPELPEKLIEADENPRNRALVSLMANTFVHVYETIHIKPSDIDYEKEALSIINLREQIRIRCLICSEKLAKKYSFCPACGNKVTQALREENEQRYQRIIPIDCGTLDSIKRYLEWRRRYPYRGELLFPFTRQRAWQIVEKLGRRIGLKGLHPESLRQLLTVRWVNKGLDLKKLKYLLGYASMAAHPPSFSFEQLKSEYQKLWETEQDEP
jgi:site-specific recombinase XerD